MTHRLARRLLWVAAGIALVAIGWQVVPLRPRLPPVPHASPTPPPLAPDANAQVAAALTYQGIVRRNPFDPGRTTPSARYVPPELRVAQHAPSTQVAPGQPLRLLGVAAGPAGAVALIDADPLIPGAEIYRVGDRVGGYRLESIVDTAVVLRGAAGTRTLRLESLTGRSR